MATVSEIAVRVTADVRELQAGLAQGTGSLKTFQTQTSSTANASQQAATKMGGAFSSVSSTLKTLAPVFLAVGGAAVAGITKGIAATQQWASDTRTLQKVTGQTAEGASTLLAASSLLGIGVDKLSVGFGTLSKNIVNGSPNLEKYGITVRDTTGQLLPFDEILGVISDKFLELPAGPEQAAFAMNVFGRSGKELIPILAKGREGIAELSAKAEELGLVMGQDDLDAAKALSASQRELGLAFKGAAISLGQLFIPALTKLVQIATKVIEFFTHLPDPVKEVGVGLALAAGAVGALTVAFSGLKSTFGPVIEGITSVGKSLFEAGLFQDAGVAISGVATAAEVVGDTVASSSQQISESAGGATESLTTLHDATTIAATAAEAASVKTAKAAGAFSGLGETAAGAGSKIGAAFARIGPALAGVGAAIAAAAPEILIVVAIAAAIAAAAFLIIKNWDAIKRALQPALDALGKAFAALRAAVGDVLSALGDAFREVAAALAPLLPILGPIVAAFIKLSAALQIGVIIVALKLLTLQLNVLAFALEQGATGIRQISDALGPILRVAIQAAVAGFNFLIDGLNKVISGINDLIKFSNLVLGTNFELIGSIDHVGQAADDAAPPVTALGAAVADTGNAATETARQFHAMVPNLRGIAPLLDAMGQSAGDFRAAAIEAGTTAAEAITTGATEGADAFQKFADQAIESARTARAAFQDQMAQALTFTDDILSKLESRAADARSTLAGDTGDLTGTQLDALRKQADLTATDILNTFRVATTRTKGFGRDLVEVAQIGGKAGRDLATSLATSGDILAAQVIADAPKKLQDQIVTAFGKSEKAAESFSEKLTNAIVGPLNDIRDILIKIAGRFGITIDLNDHGAQAQLTTLVSRLNEAERDRYIDIYIRQHGAGGQVIHSGGPVFHSGGAVETFHQGRLASDEVPAVLQRGEFVVQRRAVQHLGVGVMHQINRMHDGGAVTARPPAPTNGQRAAVTPQDLKRAFKEALREEREKLYLDQRRFTRDLDYAVLTDGSW